MVKGIDLRHSNITGLNLNYLINAYQQLTQAKQVFFERADFMDKLAGTDQLRLAIEAGRTAEEIKQSWQAGLEQFKQQRAPYLLYQ